MPVYWTETNLGAPDRSGAPVASDGPSPPPLYQVVLTPHRSMSRRGFAWLLLILWLFLLVPLIPLIGSLAMWVMLAFLLAALGALWYFIEINYHDGTLSEILRIWPDNITLVRSNPRAAVQNWQANPYWARIQLRRPKGGPVDNYVTLKSSGREVELGAFLTPDERADLCKALNDKLTNLQSPDPVKAP